MADKIIKRGLMERGPVRAGIVIGVIVLLCVAFASINLDPNLSHLDAAVLSGSTQGNYYAVVKKMAAVAEHRRGKLENVATKGSLENIERLTAAADDCEASFALSQDGLPWGDGDALELIARLTTSETVFVLGREARAIRTFADLTDKSIGIGPEGSGTARLAQQIFEARGLGDLGIKPVHFPIDEQLIKLQRGDLDLGMFVIARDSKFIDDAVRKGGLQIASFEHADALAHRLPVVRAEWIEAGHYDPVKVIPPLPRRVLVVDTLVIGNGCADRAATVGLLTLLEDTFPGLIAHNRGTPNSTGLPLNKHAGSFFDNEGPELLDEYAPWLANLIPLSNLVQLIMVVSILFNVMGAGHRFRLWRIDAGRVSENLLPEIFGPGAVIQEIANMQPADDHRTDEKRAQLDALIAELVMLKDRARKHSVSMLVPMGQEMSYRYQESLVGERIAALRSFRARLN